MTTKAKTEKPDPIEGETEDGLPWRWYPVGREWFQIRAITVGESDAAYDASLNGDGTFNARLNGRLELAASIMSPKVVVDDFERWPTGKLLALLNASVDINRLPPADAEGNA